MKQILLGLAVALSLIAGDVAGAATGAEAELDAAKERGHDVFVVVTHANADGTDRALAIAREAQALVAGSEVVLVDRAARENAALVQRFRVLAAPVPLVLVVAKNGIVAGGALLKDATPQVLANLVPTPKKAEMLEALSNRLPVFVLAMGPEMEGGDAAMGALEQAYAALEKRVATVGIDVRDQAEAPFLKELAIDPKAKRPVVVVFNAKGQKTAVFREGVTAAQLVEAAKKAASCCPGGSC